MKAVTEEGGADTAIADVRANSAHSEQDSVKSNKAVQATPAVSSYKNLDSAIRPKTQQVRTGA